MQFQSKRDFEPRPPEQLDYIYSTTRRQLGLIGDQYEPLGYLLYLNPSGGIEAEPVIDDLTKKITAAFRMSVENGIKWRGYHMCTCGACSTNTDYILPDPYQTNSLAIHYVGLHRSEVPEDQLEIINAFSVDPVEPTLEELKYP